MSSPLHSYPHKYYYHEVLVYDTSQSTSPLTGAIVVKGGVGIQGNLSLGGQLLTSGNWTNTSTTPSTSVTSGALVLNGGISVNVTDDAISFSNGGALTLAGGAAIGKRLFVGDSVIGRGEMVISTANGTTDGASIVLGYPNSPSVVDALSSNMWTWTVNSDNDIVLRNINSSALSRDAIVVTETTGAVSLKSKQSTTLVNIQPNREDQSSEQTFTSSTDVVGTAVDVTGLVFYTSRAFHCELVAFIDATSPTSAMFELRGIKSGNDVWNLAVDQILGDVASITFSITSGGQVQYTKTTTAGHVSTTFKWRTRTTYD